MAIGGGVTMKQVDVTVLSAEYHTYRIEVPDDVDVDDQEAVEMWFYSNDDWPEVDSGSGDSVITDVSEVEA